MLKMRKEELEEILESGRDYSLSHILTDKKFFDLVKMVKKDFDIGFKQFSNYRKESSEELH
jgi:hypothetical protein